MLEPQGHRDKRGTIIGGIAIVLLSIAIVYMVGLMP